jgi:hypothetical protein
VGYRKTQTGWLLVLTTVLMLTAGASAQVTVGDNIQMGLNGDASVGWTGQYDGQDTSSLAFGFNGNLTGSYYNPKFLNWRINPYYNQSRFNSNFNSISAAKGVNAAVGLFTGSNTPIEVNFQKAYDAQSQLNFPGTTGAYETRGNSTSFDVNAGLYYEDYPTLNVSFGQSASNYEVLGSDTTGSGDSRFFTTSSSYTLAGFDLSGRFNLSRIGNTLPFASGFDGEKVNTYQRGLTFSSNRRLLDWMRWGATYSRNHVNTDYVLNPTNASFSVVNTDLSMTPTSKLSVNVFTNYSSNVNAQIISGIVGGGPSGGAGTPAALPTRNVLSNYLDYGANAGYAVTQQLTVTARIDRRQQDYSQSSITTTSDVFSSGVSYGRNFLGGNIGAHYGFSWFDTNAGNAGATGHSASLSYTRDVLGFNAGVGGQYSHNVATALVGYSQDGYSGNASIAHPLWRGWNVGVGGTYGKNKINGLSEGATSIQSFNATLSAPRFSLSGSYNKNYGNSLPFGTGGGVVPPIIPGLIFYRGNSWGVAAGVNPTRRLHITGSYSHTQYHTDNLTSITDSLSNRLEIRSEYRWRQMTFNGGYAQISQGIGATFNSPDTIKVVYFGVTRHFDVF